MTMPDLAFDNAGTNGARGIKNATLALTRRLLRRLMRPFFHRLTDILQYLCVRLDTAEAANHQLRANLDRIAQHQVALSEASDTAMALGWDHVALVRRLAVLEDRVESLTAQLESRNACLDSNQNAAA